MKKLVLTLVIILPLILLVAIFAVTGVGSINTQIPASGITIGNKGDDGVFSFDMASYTSPMTEEELGVEVEPYVARNKKYSLSVTDAKTGEPSDKVSVNDNGEFVLHDVGVSKLTYTSDDGGYTDSVLFNVTSSGVIDFTPQIKLENGTAISLSAGTDTDYQATIQSGKYMLSQAYYPSNVSAANTTYASTGISVQADASSSMSALFAGESVLSFTVHNQNGGALDETITKTVKLTVQKCADMTINGLDATSANLNAPINQKSFSFFLELPDNLSKEDVSISGVNLNGAPQIEQIAGTAHKVTINLANAYDSPRNATYYLHTKGALYATFKVKYDNYDFNVYSANALNGKADVVMLMGGNDVHVKAVATPSDNVKYTFTIDNEQIAQIQSQNGDSCALKAVSLGNATLLVDWIAYDNDNNVSAQGSFSRNVVVANKYTSMLFGENAHSYGLGNLAIAKYKFEGEEVVENNYQFAFSLFDGVTKLSTLDDVTIKSSNDEIVSIDVVSGKIVPTIKASGEVTITASWEYGKLFGVEDAVLNFVAVKGVEVSTYKQLVDANNLQHEIVLANDVYLGEELFTVSNGTRTPKYDDATMAQKLQSYTSTVKTTADWTYYKNIGQEQPSVRYCFEFNNNFYGNGHTLNAEYITNMLDSTDNLYDFAVFRGPLDFVATSDQSTKIAAVKGQDNISFLVRKDNVTIYNTTLKGCDDATLYENGLLNLSLLNNIGTTLEIMADASIQNCRIQNGRTVLRAYGRDNVDANSYVNVTKEKINVTIDGCVLQNAREFLLKIGTNRAIRGTVDNPSPHLTNQNGLPYQHHNSSQTDNYLADEFFVEQYVLNDVTLKDSTLSTSGLFTIGVESHFAGSMLAGNSSLFALPGWHDLAATSYPAILRLVGNVKLDDWKNLENIDSSTLIEVGTSSSLNISFLNLNVAEMLKAIQQYGNDQYGKEAYKDIIYNKDGELFAHGGIAFYGGGKNYSLLDTSQYTFESMKHYTVNISTLANSSDEDLKRQGQLLPEAAGAEDFRFVMFDATSNYKPN